MDARLRNSYKFSTFAENYAIMEKQISKRLTVPYYLMLLGTLLVYCLGYWFGTQGWLKPLSPESTIGMAIQYIVYFDVLISLPLGLYWFKQKCVKLSRLEDETLRYSLYEKYAKWRILLVGHTMMPAMAGFWLLGTIQGERFITYRPMIWIAAIGAIGWYFTKPLPGKIAAELNPNQEETY